MGIAEERREKLSRMRLYVITGDHGGEAETVRTIEGALEGGANVVQLRKKTMPKGEQYTIALALRRLTHIHGALFIVNDHPDIAIAADADGVHLGQDDLPPGVVRDLPGFGGSRPRPPFTRAPITLRSARSIRHRPRKAGSR